MSSAHMNRIGGGSLPVPPPPPILTNHPRSRRDGDRSTRRSRSRSRNRDRTDRGGGERFHSRSRRSSSPSYRRRDIKSGGSYSSGAPPTQQLPQQQTISVIPPKDVPQIIRRVLNADDIKMPRRPHEGKKPIFERDELREAIANRIRSGCDDDTGIVLPHLEQQVVAIIREPVVSRDLSFPSSLNLQLPNYLEPQQISPGLFSGSGVLASFRRQQSLSPHSRGVGILTSRSLERIDRELRERDRERERDRRDKDRGNPPEVMNRGRSRSRSIEGRRSERIHRSRSPPPSPMTPPERRRMEYDDRERDLRSSLSRPAGKSFGPKFYGEHDRREPGTSYRGRGSFRGSRRPFRSRGFHPRGSRGHYERDRAGFWQHDMYEREEQESGESKN